jgi:hypothetical protein
MQKSETVSAPHSAQLPHGVGVVGGVDLNEIDLGELDASDLTLSASNDALNPEIAAVFPEPLPADDPSQDFFAAAAKAEQAKTVAADASPDRRTSTTTVKGSTLAEAKAANAASGAAGASTAKKQKKKGGAKNKAGAAAEGDDAAAVKRAELRQKLENKKMMQKEFGGKAKRLNQLGLSLDEVGEAVREEASGKRVSSGKQERVMEKAQKMFGGLLGNMDSKQRNYLSKKKDEVSGMVSDVFDRVLSGPVKGHHTNNKKKPNHATAAAAAAATSSTPGGGKEQEDEVPELTPTLDPQLDDFVRGIHDKSKPKSNKSNKSNKSKPATKPTELPLRPRVGDTTNNDATLSVPSSTATSSANQPPTKNQLKNKRKRQKGKEKLKLLKSNAAATSGQSASSQSAAPSAATAKSQHDTIPELVPVK